MTLTEPISVQCWGKEENWDGNEKAIKLSSLLEWSGWKEKHSGGILLDNWQRSVWYIRVYWVSSLELKAMVRISHKAVPAQCVPWTYKTICWWHVENLRLTADGGKLNQSCVETGYLKERVKKTFPLESMVINIFTGLLESLYTVISHHTCQFPFLHEELSTILKGFHDLGFKSASWLREVQRWLCY